MACAVGKGSMTLSLQSYCAQRDQSLVESELYQNHWYAHGDWRERDMAQELPRAFNNAFSVQSSQPMLSPQSSQLAANGADAYTRVGDADTTPESLPELPLRLEIYGLRLLTSTTLLMATLALLTFLLIDGFSIRTIYATTLSSDSKSALLDHYNTYSGSIASIVSISFLAFVAMLLPVFFLCFMTKLALTDSNSFLTLWIPVVVVAAVSW